MTQLSSGTTIRAKAKPNVYSVLAIVATVVLAVGVGYLWKTNLELTQVPARTGRPAHRHEPVLRHRLEVIGGPADWLSSAATRSSDHPFSCALSRFLINYDLFGR
jgi:hypothetical protein